MHLAQRKQSKSMCTCTRIYGHRQLSPYSCLCRSSNPQWYGTGTHIALLYEPYHTVTVWSPTLSEDSQSGNGKGLRISSTETISEGFDPVHPNIPLRVGSRITLWGNCSRPCVGLTRQEGFCPKNLLFIIGEILEFCCTWDLMEELICQLLWPRGIWDLNAGLGAGWLVWPLGC